MAPTNYKIMQADFKSFQPRLAIFCTTDEAFKSKFKNIEDIYSVFPGDREENKLAFISWMFSNRKDAVFDKEAEAILSLRSQLYSMSNKDGFLFNKFNRPIFYHEEEKNVVFQNYITANEVDMVLAVMVELHKFLKDKKSRIAFPFHDCLVFYIHKDEMELVESIKNLMETYHREKFGTTFPVAVQIGENFGEMQNWH